MDYWCWAEAVSFQILKAVEMAKTDHKQKPLPARIRETFAEYPSQFWIVVGGTFVDRLGGAMLFPFFTLYLTRKFEIGMTEVGAIFGMFSISSFIGSMIGGAMTDRLGRKSVLLFGLVMSALSAVLMGIIDNLTIFLVVTLVVGILSDVGGPAHQSLVADILPEHQRASGFGILRVVFNLAVVIGPLIGGLLATTSYLYLFITDAITSSVTALILFFALKETHKPAEEGKAPETMGATFKGYLTVLKDTAFVWFIFASILMTLVYLQMNTTLAVYLRDVHNLDERGFSYILSLNAIMVVLFQFSVTRWISKYRPLVVMTAGTLLYAFGFAMYGVVGGLALFMLAMVIITIGEMFVAPVGQAIVARLAPEAMRGRYMAVNGFSWLIPFAIGPLMAGLVMDNFDPRLLWYLAGVVGVIAAATFYSLEIRAGRARFRAIDERLAIMENLEEGRITAEEASQQLTEVNEGVWVRLTAPEETPERKHVRIRVSDRGSQIMKSDLRIPMGLVNAVLYAGGSISQQLDGYDNQALRSLIHKSTQSQSAQRMQTGEDEIDVSIE